MNQRRADAAYIDADLWIPKTLVNVEGVKSSLTFTGVQGPRRSEISIPLYRETEAHLVVPREYWSHTQFQCPFYDCRPREYHRTEVVSRIKLDHHMVRDKLVPTGKSYQQEAVTALINAMGGVLQLACGKGKSVIALEVIARLHMPALIVVDNINLLDQWKRLIETCLHVPSGIGYIQADKYTWRKDVVLATYQTLAEKAGTMTEEVRRWFGVTIWDEAHHLSAMTFCRSANLFYGRRYGLSATPKRADGLHVIQEFHVGPVLYKDLMQDIKPRIQFVQTGFRIDMGNPEVAARVIDTTGNINLGKLYTHFGGWKERLAFIIQMVQKLRAEGRKILVLSNSVTELTNLLATWNNTRLLDTVPIPEPKDIGYTGIPIMLSDDAVRSTAQRIEELDPIKSKVLRDTLIEALEAHDAAKKLEALYQQARNKHIRQTLDTPSTAGILMQAVNPKVRNEMLENKMVTFAISKYGKEGLDNPALDTVIACSPMSSKAMLQQVMGRVQRHKEGKKRALFIVLEDDIDAMHGMCGAMKAHLRQWPLEDGGPYSFEIVKNAELQR